MKTFLRLTLFIYLFIVVDVNVMHELIMIDDDFASLIVIRELSVSLYIISLSSLFKLSICISIDHSLCCNLNRGWYLIALFQNTNEYVKNIRKNLMTNRNLD